LDPCGEVADDLIREAGAAAFGWRHFDVRVVVADGLDEEAGFRVSRDHDGPVDAALEEVGSVIEAEATAQAFRCSAVAFEALGREDRADLVFEEGEIGILRG
jgi:hypothetical protein